MKDMSYFNKICDIAESKFISPRIVHQSSSVVGGTNYVHKIENIDDSTTQWCVYNEDGRFLKLSYAIKSPLVERVEPDMTDWVNNGDIEQMILIRGGDSSVAFEIDTYIHDDSIGMKTPVCIYFADYDGSVEVNKISSESGNWEIVGHTTVDLVVDAVASNNIDKIVNGSFLDNKQM